MRDAQGLFDLSGKVALVTGGDGASGLGMAKGLAEQGAAVVTWGNKAGKNEQAVELLRSFGGEVRRARADVADEAAVAQGAAAIVAEFGRIDVAIANAGIGIPRRTMFDISVEDFRRIQDINVHGGVLHAARSRAPYDGTERSGRPGRVADLYRIDGLDPRRRAQ